LGHSPTSVLLFPPLHRNLKAFGPECSSVVECLPSIHKALYLIPSTTTKPKKPKIFGSKIRAKNKDEENKKYLPKVILGISNNEEIFKSN
jgi:hypothetical protein